MNGVFFFSETLETVETVVTVAIKIKLEKNKQNPLSALEAMLLAQNATKICL